jgi:hypothetical protein
MNMLMDYYDNEGDSVMRYVCPDIIEIEDDDDVVEIKPDIKHEIITIEDEKPYKKKYIPKPVKRNVWNKWVGKALGTSLCLCCKLTEIDKMSFHCGHIIAEKNGGEISVDNLRPICQSCNSSMGTQNMDEFIKKYKL